MRYSQSGISKDTRPWGKMFVAGAAAVTLSVALFASVFAAPAPTLYDATPTPTPPNVVSLGFQATSTSELGDRIVLADDQQDLSRVEVTMSTWAKASEYANNSEYNSVTGWTHPITVNVYSVAADGLKGDLLGTQQELVQIPWREEADNTCQTPTAWRADDNQCYNGLAFTAGVDFDTPLLNLPEEVIVSVAYNTQSYGTTPLGVAGPYNSLNVGIPDNQDVTTGNDYNVDEIYWNSTYLGRAAGLTVDNGWAPNGTVALKLVGVETDDLIVATTKDQCKNGGWENVVRANETSFKNQGQCVAYVQSSDNSKHRR